MRALKTLLIILAALVALIFVLYLLGPAETHMVRTISVNAPANVVYGHVNNMRSIDSWSPWRDQDSTVVVTFEGEDGAIGSKSSWDGKMLGQGSQTITSLEENKKVGIGLHFIKPFEADATADIDLEPAGETTNVSWHYDAKNAWMSRLFGLFMDSEKMMGPIFEQGMAKLKTLAEADGTKAAEERAKALNGFDVATSERAATVYAGKREVVKWKDLKDFFAKQFGNAFKAVGKAELKPGTATALYFEWDEKNQQADVAAVVPIDAAGKDKVKGVDIFETPASKTYEIVYKGGYAGSGKAHEAISAKMGMDGVKMNGNVIEEYVVDPMQQPDSTQWVTNIIYLVK